MSAVCAILIHSSRKASFRCEDHIIAWRPTGPVGEVYAIDFDAARWQRHDGFANEEGELANMRARLDHMTEPDMKADARVEVRLSGG